MILKQAKKSPSLAAQSFGVLRPILQPLCSKGRKNTSVFAREDHKHCKNPNPNFEREAIKQKMKQNIQRGEMDGWEQTRE